MNFKLRSLLAVAVLSLGLFTTATKATSISAYTATENSDTDYQFADATIGFSFQSSQDIFVTSLGVFDSNSLGLIDAHDVGIWTDTGTLLSSTTVASGTTAELIDGFRYSDITTLKLFANETYIVAATFFDKIGVNNDAYLYEPSISTATEITMLYPSQNISASGETLTFPNYYSNPALAAANFQFDLTNPSVVPVPAAAWLFGSALLGFFGFSRRKART